MALAGQTIAGPVRQTGDGALVAPTVSGSSVTVKDPSGVAVVDGAAIVLSGSTATYTFVNGEPSTTYTLGDGWTVIWVLVIAGEIYTFRHAAILVEYVPPNIITAADLYGGQGIPELRMAIPQAQTSDRGDGTGWAPQIDAAYYGFIRKMLADGRPIWKSREPTGYWDWLFTRSILNAVDTIPAPDGSMWAQERRQAFSKHKRAEAGIKLQYDDIDVSIRKPGSGPIYTSPVGRPAW